MQYLFLFLACTLFSVQFIFTKLFSRGASEKTHIGIWYGCFVAVCIMLYLFPMNHFQWEFTPTAGLIALLFALCGVTINLSNIQAMRLGNMAVVTTYLLIGGMVLPFAYGVLALKEDCSPLKLIAITVLIAAIIPNLFQGKKENENKRSRKEIIAFHALGLIVFTLNGLISILTTIHSLHENKISSEGFTFLCAFCQFILTLLFLIGYTVYKRIKGEKNALRYVWIDVTNSALATPKKLLFLLCFVFCYALCNGGGNIFSQESLTAGMPSSVQFPVISGAVIVFTALFGSWFFGEKISQMNALSLILSVIGSVLFMLA